MTLYVSGDTHGIWDAAKIRQINATNDDYIIICGDCGVLWDKQSAPKMIDFYNDMSAPILFVDGNHENFDMLGALPVTEFLGGRVHKISERIYHLMRGEIYTIANRKILAIGGGESHDRMFRKEGKTWWRAEAICNANIQNALFNLAKCDNKVDIVLSHIPPSKFKNLMIEEFMQCGEDVPKYLEEKLVDTRSEELLKQIEKVAKFKYWFSGHLHTDTHIDKYYSLYDDVVPIKL